MKLWMLNRRRFFAMTIGALFAPFLPTDPNKIVSSYAWDMKSMDWHSVLHRNPDGSITRSYYAAYYKA